MGWGDELIATGLARGAAARGKRIAFGDGRSILWSPQARELFRGNPNIAPPGCEGARDVEWIEHYRGNRLYGSVKGRRWHFRDFECPPGEVFLTPEEKHHAIRRMHFDDHRAVVVIEPRVKPMGACHGANKQWPVERYAELASALLAATGARVVQLLPPGLSAWFPTMEKIETPTFRHAVAAIGLASLYIGPEGGLHHAAAAMGTPAVVIFGGFNSPRSTGYPQHINLTAGGDPCGSIDPCPHCAKAMRSISVARVLSAASEAVTRHVEAA